MLSARGRDGEFDLLVASAIRRAVKQYGYGNTSLILALPYMKAEYRDNEQNYLSCYDEVEICSESSNAHYNSRIFDAKSRLGKFSGGEQRLLQVFSVIATRSDADLLIIDEPLNNLDFVNARHISNLINKVIREHPQMGLLMISHCRIFPFITRELKLTANGISEISEPYTCHSCFGEHDENGFYK